MVCVPAVRCSVNCDFEAMINADFEFGPLSTYSCGKPIEA